MPESRGVGAGLLNHVLANVCQNPDCEIHNIDVGIAEEVLRDSDVAFWLAGAYAMLDLISNSLDNAFDSALAELKDQANLNGR